MTTINCLFLTKDRSSQKLSNAERYLSPNYLLRQNKTLSLGLGTWQAVNPHKILPLGIPITDGKSFAL